MKAVLDACVLYPTVLREILLGVAGAGLYQPVWSARILDEWLHVAARLGPGGTAVAEGERALLQAAWPAATVAPDPQLETSLYLPDASDRHVLATAISAGADIIVTLNLRDFPRRRLEEFGLSAVHPDAFLCGLLDSDEDAVARVVRRVHGEAERLSGETIPLRALLKRARLPRLAKALERRGRA